MDFDPNAVGVYNLGVYVYSLEGALLASSEISVETLLYEGCTDPAACNYQEGASVDNGTCDVPDADCDICVDGSSVTVDDNGNGIPDCEDVYGCDNPLACNYDEAVTVNDGTRCARSILPNVCGWFVSDVDTDGDGILDCEEILGCTDTSAINYDPTATESVNDTCIIYGCEEATDDDGSCVFYEPQACNYNPAATIDDGTCEIVSCAGCTNPLACNYDAESHLRRWDL